MACPWSPEDNSQQIMNLIIDVLLKYQQLSQDISCLVNEKMGKELEFLVPASTRRRESVPPADETLRSYQRADRQRR